MKNIIVTAGPTNERIDAVMKITNMSTGSLGSTITNTLLNNYSEQIDTIFYISPLLAKKPIENSKIKLIEVDSTAELLQALEKIFAENKIDVIIHSAAVGDYKGKYVIRAEDIIDEIIEKLDTSKDKEFNKKMLMDIFENPSAICKDDTKISSYEPHLMTMLDLTPKVISRIKQLDPTVKLIGFKLLEGVSKQELYEVAHNLLVKNHAEYIVANDLAQIKDGKHPAMIINKNGVFTQCETKQEIATVLSKLAVE